MTARFIKGNLAVVRDGRVATLPFQLDFASGTGHLTIGREIRCRKDWRQSAMDSWAMAKALTGVNDWDATLHIETKNLQAGWSAGITLALTAIAGLTNQTLPPFYASGRVIRPIGFLAGGAAASQKAKRIGNLHSSRQTEVPILIVPPLMDKVEVQGVQVREATDIHAALSFLDLPNATRVDRETVLSEIDPWVSRAGLASSESGVIIIGAHSAKERTSDTGVRIIHLPSVGHPFALFCKNGQVMWGCFLSHDTMNPDALSRLWQAADRATGNNGYYT